MPNGQVAVDVAVARPATMNGAALLGGAIQRVAWEVSTPLGFISTGAMALGGAAGAFFTEGLGQALMEGIAAAGFTTAGWIATEQFLLPAAARAKGGALGQGAGRGAGRGARALGAGHVNGYDPEAALLVRPQEEEEEVRVTSV